MKLFASNYNTVFPINIYDEIRVEHKSSNSFVYPRLSLVGVWRAQWAHAHVHKTQFLLVSCLCQVICVYIAAMQCWSVLNKSLEYNQLDFCTQSVMYTSRNVLRQMTGLYYNNHLKVDVNVMLCFKAYCFENICTVFFIYP